MMTMAKLITRLNKNAATFTAAGELAKGVACTALVTFIRDKGYESISGKF